LLASHFMHRVVTGEVEAGSLQSARSQGEQSEFDANRNPLSRSALSMEVEHGLERFSF
jgi:hypothetical protein